MSAPDPPALRKADGVYYTPPAVVDELVTWTLAPLLRGASPERVAELKILDPACGSGAFLLGVYRHLLARRSPGDARPSPELKLGILSANVFGVDIDPRAVEAAKRALVRELLADETKASLGQSRASFEARARGELDANIKVGNALVDHDFDPEADGAPGPAESIAPLSWPEQFPAAFARARPGFDVVLGNPPYVDAEWMSRHRPATRAYCARRYAAASGNWDLFCAFIERALQLLRRGGVHSFIVPNKLASADYAAAARRLLTGANTLTALRDYSTVRLFPVAVYPLVYRVEGQPPEGRPAPVTLEVMSEDEKGLAPAERRELDYPSSFADDGRPWPIFSSSAALDELLRAVDGHPTLDQLATVLGAATVAEAYELLPLLADAAEPAAGDLRVLNSGTIDPHRPLWGLRPMRYLKHSFDCPVVRAEDQAALPSKRLSQARSPKLIVAGMTRSLECVIDRDGRYLAAKSTTIVLPSPGADLDYLGALLNSRLMTLLFRARFGGLALQGGYLRVGPPQLRQLPVPMIAEDDGPALATVEAIAEQARALEASLADPRRARSLRASIDERVCALYGLREAQTRTVLES